MIRTSIYGKANKNEVKKQKSQQPKAIRSRKNNSPSPIYKEININKQNQNPNKSPLQTGLETANYRQAYYRCKEQILNSKIDRQKLSGHPISPSSLAPPKQIPREIQIRINNKSLEKCQIHPEFQPSPKAQFLINHPQKDKQDILCCESCGWMYGNKKISLEKLTNTTIAPGLTIKEYFLRLEEKIDGLEIAKTNLVEYAKEFRNISSLQSQKLRKYYNDILEIIEVSMKESEDILMKYINEGEKSFTEKKDQIEAELDITKKQLKKLLVFQQKQFQFQFGNQKANQFNVQVGLKNYQLEMNIPIFHTFTQLPEIMPNFQKLFKKFYSIHQLSPQQLDKNSKQRQQQTNKNENYLNYRTASQSYQRSSARQEEDADLFCDESLGESKSNKTHDFSFEKSNDGENQLGKNNDCILELVEEEDVISPVFKAI